MAEKFNTSKFDDISEAVQIAGEIKKGILEQAEKSRMELEDWINRINRIG